MMLCGDSSSSRAPTVRSSDLDHSSRWHLHNTGIDDVRETVAILMASNRQCLQSQIRWCAFLWRRSHHWEVAIRPSCDPCKVRVDSDLLHEKLQLASPDLAVHEVSSANLFLIFDLVIGSETDDFSIRLKVDPSFDSGWGNVQSLGCFGALGLNEIAERAITAIGTFDSYSMIGGNCQHFAIEFLGNLGIRDSSLVPEDQQAAQVTRQIVRVSYMVGGVAKAGAAVVAGGTVGVVVGHVALGVAIAGMGYAAVGQGYDRLCERHRKRSLPVGMEPAAKEPAPLAPSADSLGSELELQPDHQDRLSALG